MLYEVITQFATLTVTDDVLFSKVILLTEIHAKFHCFLVDGREIRGIGQPILTDFKSDMRIVRRTSCVPSAMIPRQRLIGCDAAVRQFADEAMDADLSAIRLILIPMVVVLIFSEQSIIGTDIAFQVRITSYNVCYTKLLRYPP